MQGIYVEIRNAIYDEETIMICNDNHVTSEAILFDSFIQYIMHVESIIGLGGYIINKVIN